MKKIFLVFMICSCMFLSRINIQIDKKYTFKDYQKEYTEDGCVVTINYEITNGD